MTDPPQPRSLRNAKIAAVVVVIAGLVVAQRFGVFEQFAEPGRVTPGLVAALAADKALFVCVHANHAREFSAGAREAVARLVRAGIPLLGQSVLLRGVNDSVDALEGLFRAMLSARIKPYYLHQLDRAPGTARFEVPVEEGLLLLKELRGRVTGLAWPTFVRETPGGRGKLPLGPAFT